MYQAVINDIPFITPPDINISINDTQHNTQIRIKSNDIVRLPGDPPINIDTLFDNALIQREEEISFSLDNNEEEIIASSINEKELKQTKKSINIIMPTKFINNKFNNVHLIKVEEDFIKKIHLENINFGIKSINIIIDDDKRTIDIIYNNTISNELSISVTIPNLFNMIQDFELLNADEIIDAINEIFDCNLLRINENISKEKNLICHDIIDQLMTNLELTDQITLNKEINNVTIKETINNDNIIITNTQSDDEVIKEDSNINNKNKD